MPDVDELRVRVERRGPVCFLMLSGRLSARSSARVAAAITGAADPAAGHCRVVVDLSGVRSIDPIGAQALTAGMRSVPGACAVVLRSLRPSLRPALEAANPGMDPLRSGLRLRHTDAAAEPDTDSPLWTLVQRSRRLRSQADQTIIATRRAAGVIAATEDEIAATLSRRAAIRPRASGEVLALSRAARGNADRLRERAGHTTAPADRYRVSSGTLRDAIAFIDRNARDDISVADIATATHVTVRAIQLAFRHHLATTPLGYLRQVRLENAHRALLAASPASSSVTTIAADWQFANPSRFAARYRATYGVSPGHTLRQAAVGDHPVGC